MMPPRSAAQKGRIGCLYKIDTATVPFAAYYCLMNILVIGTGYVGLVVGSCLAETGNDVICADIDTRKIDDLRQNILPIYEPGLPDLVARNQSERRLTFTTDVAAAARTASVVFIAVGTPPGEDGSADLSHVLAATRTRQLIKGSHPLVHSKNKPAVTALREIAAGKVVGWICRPM